MIKATVKKEYTIVLLKVFQNTSSPASSMKLSKPMKTGVVNTPHSVKDILRPWMAGMMMNVPKMRMLGSRKSSGAAV
jgi:hypothetical protein